jgi:hypothetical protein
MSVILTALVMAHAEFHPLNDCVLVRPVTFFEDLSALPTEIMTDFAKRVGVIYPRTEKGVNFSDVVGPTSKVGRLLIYVANHENQWLVSYTCGSISIRTVTVAYIQSTSKTSTEPYLSGALEGDGCVAANTFLHGIDVEPGWSR